MIFGERRRHKRYKIELKAPYAVTRLEENIEGKGIIRDIGYGGLRLDIREKLRKRAHLIIPLIVRNLNIYVTVAGKIIWMKSNAFASYGIKIDWISDKDAYKKYIEILESADKIYYKSRSGKTCLREALFITRQAQRRPSTPFCCGIFNERISCGTM